MSIGDVDISSNSKGYSDPLELDYKTITHAGLAVILDYER
ncbi:hypothetical protein BH18THE2_BH18THE2_30370 [soil metagenome]